MKKPFVIQVVGFKNSGKTTLVCKLVEGLIRLGHEVGTVKHDAHRFEMDREGKDTWRHREAGARVVAISSETEGRTCYIEQRYTPLDGILDRMAGLDFVVVEGYKSEGYPKIVLIRRKEDLELLQKIGPILAVGSWLDDPVNRTLIRDVHPVRHIDDAEGILQLILAAAFFP